MTANHREANVTRWIDGSVRTSPMKARAREALFALRALRWNTESGGCSGGGGGVGIS